MTTQEAIEGLEDMRETMYQEMRKNTFNILKNDKVLERYDNAQEMAIRSLEAWELIKKEIEEVGYARDEYGDIRSDILTVNKVMKIINKHLKEVIND